MRTILLVLVLVLAPLTDAIAQELPLQPGQRVRVTVPSRRLYRFQETFQQMRGDTLVLESGWCLFADVTRLDVHRGQKSAWASGLLYGSLAGALIGSLAGAAQGADPDASHPGGSALVGGIFLGGVGAVSGLVIGALTKTDQWEEVPLDRLRVSVVPMRNGFGIGVSIAF